MRGKIFTRDEANRMIPLIRRIALGARARHRLIQRKQDEILSLGTAPSGEHARKILVREVRRLRENLLAHVVELEELGCFLRDQELGVVECYGELNSDIVYFTWLWGDRAFLSWHPLDQSYVKRQPLPGVSQPTVREAAE